MRVPKTAELLNTWEQGINLRNNDRAILMLQTARPDVARQQLAEISIGQRDGLLLQFREALFGSVLTCVAACPDCRTQLEMNLNVADIRLEMPPNNDNDLRLSVKGHEIVFRLPNSIDLSALATVTDEAGSSVSRSEGDSKAAPAAVPGKSDTGAVAPQQVLLERCVLAATHNKQNCAVTELPESVVNALVQQMSDMDPQANIELDLHCPSCTTGWLAPFDIVSYLWNEINSWAKRILQDVHALALAYGWSEHDILEMHPVKRQMYLQLVYT